MCETSFDITVLKSELEITNECLYSTQITEKDLIKDIVDATEEKTEISKHSNAVAEIADYLTDKLSELNQDT